MSPGAHKQPNRKTQRETFMNLLCPLSCTDRMANIQQNFFYSLTLSLALARSLCKTWNEKSVSVFKAIFISHFIRKGENFSKPERQSDSKLLFVYLRLLLSCFALKFTHSIRIRLNGCNYRRLPPRRGRGTKGNRWQNPTFDRSHKERHETQNFGIIIVNRSLLLLMKVNNLKISPLKTFPISFFRSVWLDVILWLLLFLLPFQWMTNVIAMSTTFFGLFALF